MQVPERILKAWAAWKRFAHRLGVFNTAVFLTVFYFTAFAIVGIFVKFLLDPLQIKYARKQSNWTPKKVRDVTLEDLRRQA